MNPYDQKSQRRISNTQVIIKAYGPIASFVSAQPKKYIIYICTIVFFIDSEIRKRLELGCFHSAIKRACAV